MTKLPTKRAAGLLGSLLVLGACAALAAPEETYRLVPGTPAVYRSGLTGADSLVTTPPVAGRATDGDPTLVVSPRFSAASATCCVEVLLYGADGTTQMGVAAVLTATGSGLRRNGAAGYYLTEQPLLFDTMGAPMVDVRLRAVSSGTVDLWVWKVGARSVAFGSSQ